VAHRLIEGLRCLEYRGFDSAGIATLVDGYIDCHRTLDLLLSEVKPPG
jgi:glucosamine--fructose-6-phosphate aminotransferase (isomerizing)